MFIKQPSLGKRYYRCTSVIVMLLPILFITGMLITGKRIFPHITRTNIAEVMKNNYTYIIYALLGYGAYALVISLIWRLIIYIGRGGKKEMKTIDTRIKKSYLEKKVLYRIAKVLYLTLPLAAFIILTTKGYIDISDIKAETIAKNSYGIGAGVAAIILYYLIINGLRKLIIYIGRGGSIDDTKPIQKSEKQSKTNRATRYIIQQIPVQEEKKENRGRFRLLIIIILYVASYSVTPKFSNIIPTPTKKSQCIPTGCGNNRRSSCTNNCYTTQSACMQAGDCSSKTCRKCP